MSTEIRFDMPIGALVVTMTDEESGAVLAERLHGMLYEALPAGVASARLDCTLALEPLYTRTEFVSPYGEMLSRMTGAAPVIYTLDWRQML